MEIKSIYSEEFKKYGQVLEENFPDILKRLQKLEVPNDHVIYVASVPSLEESPEFKLIEEKYFGHMPLQLGYCAGINHENTALEFHKSSEINVANEEFILVIGERKDIVNGKYDLKKAEAFLVPSGVAVEMYATTLHYCPISKGKGIFNMLVALPKGTNVGSIHDEKDRMLISTNKWLIAHEDSGEARNGFVVGLVGEKIRFPY